LAAEKRASDSCGEPTLARGARAACRAPLAAAAARAARRRAVPPPAVQSHKGAISIKQLSEMSSIKTDDIVSTLQALQLIKYWKGQHMIAVSPKVLHDHLESESARKQLQVDVSKLHWQPHSLRAA